MWKKLLSRFSCSKKKAFEPPKPEPYYQPDLPFDRPDIVIPSNRFRRNHN
jgi:hypothetical protein